MQATVSDRKKAPHKALSILLWLAVAQGSITHIVTAMQNNPVHYPYLTDPYRHWIAAQYTLATNAMSAIDPLFYQVWLSMIAKLTAGDPIALGLYSGLLSALNPFVWYLFLKEALDDELLARIGWTILLWLPSWMGIYSYFMPETLLMPLLAMALWLTWRTKRLGTMSSFVACTFAWLCASLTRPIALPIAIMSAVWLLRSDTQRKRKLIAAALIAIPMLLVPAYRTSKILGVWSPFGYPLMNQIYMASGCKAFHVQVVRDPRNKPETINYESPSMIEAPFEPLSNWKSSRQGDLNYTVYIEHGADDWLEALSKNSHGLAFQLKMMSENAVYLLFGRSWPDYDDQHDLLWEHLQVQMRWLWAPLLVLVLVGNWHYFRNKKTLPFLPTMVTVTWLLALTVCLGVNEGRYRKPIEGLLIANSLWLLRERRKHSAKAPAPENAQKGEAQDELHI